MMCGEMMDMPRRKEVRARLFKLERFIYRIGCCWYSSAARESRERRETETRELGFHRAGSRNEALRARERQRERYAYGYFYFDETRKDFVFLSIDV
jgi:hypothetical protein